MRRLLPLLIAALLLGACSSGSTAPTADLLPAIDVVAPQLLVDAVRATQDEGSVDAQFGYLDENQVGRTTITGTTRATFDGRLASADFSVAILGQASEGRMRIVDGVRYVTTADEERWTRNEPDDESSTDQIAARLQSLLTLDVELEEVGTEEVAGVDTTKYTFTQPDGDDGDVTEQGGDVWIDDEGRVRQFQFRRVRENGAVTSVIADLVTFLEFGVEVDVEAPPADLVDPAGTAWTHRPDVGPSRAQLRT